MSVQRVLKGEGKLGDAEVGSVEPTTTLQILRLTLSSYSDITYLVPMVLSRTIVSLAVFSPGIIKRVGACQRP